MILGKLKNKLRKFLVQQIAHLFFNIENFFKYKFLKRTSSQIYIRYILFVLKNNMIIGKNLPKNKNIFQIVAIIITEAQI